MNAYTSSLFVAGTDTGVGKTMTTAVLALKLRNLGIDAGVMKPFASGCEVTESGLVSEDAVFLRAAVGVEDDLELINPIRQEAPLAPLMAARLAGVSTEGWKDIVQEAYSELSRRHECVLVEGVGGLLVPVGESAGRIWNCLDLIGAWQLPVILVARRTLGTINHTCLTVAIPLPPPSQFTGLIFCDAIPVPDGDLAAQGSPAMLAELTGVPILGHLPHARKTDDATLNSMTSSIALPQI